MEKCYTDVTEFAIPASSQKLYLSPVLDGFNSEIIAYNLSTSPNLEQVKAMLEQAFTANHYENTILHSDQGWQYQHQYYHQFLEDKGIQPSMSRKGNSPDNGMMESFFGILKSEMFYGYEKTFHSLEQLEQAIVDYIDYYNNKLIKVKLKGFSRNFATISYTSRFHSNSQTNLWRGLIFLEHFLYKYSPQRYLWFQQRFQPISQ